MAFPTRFVLKMPDIFTKNTKQIRQSFRLCNTDSSNFGDNQKIVSYVGSKSANSKHTVGGILNLWLKKFEENLISEPKESIEHILVHSLGRKKISDIYKLQCSVLSKEKINEINVLCEKRLNRLPVQYVIGEWSFRGLNLKMSPPVFIPRPETEELVEIVSEEIVRENVTNILDLCCGSGAISLSLLHEQPIIKVTAMDQSKAACDLTWENAQKYNLNNRLRIIQNEINNNLKFSEKFDIIVSNPPYIFSEDLNKLQAEIKMYEDLKALDGGRDGLNIIKIILKISSHCLNENGKLFLEVEPRHPDLLHDYLLRNSTLGLAYAETFKDISGKNRFIKIIKV